MATESKWYVVKTINGKEKKVKQYLEKVINKIVSQVLLPTEKKYQIKNGKKSVKEDNSYPGYILVETTKRDSLNDYLKNIPESLGILGALTQSEVDEIIKKEKIQKETGIEPFMIGETIKIIDGPFCTFNGVIDEINEQKNRVKVIVSIFDRKTPLELDFLQIDRIK